MISRCRVELFGGLRVTQGTQVHTRFRTQKAAALLAYLALYRQRSHSREQLIELFWPDRDEAAGRDNLSTALSQLRRQLESDSGAHGILQGDWQEVRLHPEAISTDVEEFDQLLRQAGRSGENRTGLIQQAVDLYRGELLPGNYSDWAESARNHYSDAFYRNLVQLAELYEAAGQYTEALACAERALALVPFDDAVSQTQTRLRMRREQATQTARESAAVPGFVRTKPGKAMNKLAPPPPVSPKPAEKAAAPPPPVSAPLPLQLTRFYGREREREQIAHLLEAPDTRLVTLLGPGGVGKTRLSLEIAAGLAPRFGGRVHFVPLAGVTHPAQIPGALTGALQLPPDPPETALNRAAHRLSGDPALLVLDNLEQLIHDDGSPATRDVLAVIQTLLQDAPALVCLATSRIALGLGGEHVFALSPLPVPGDDTRLETLQSNESVALYRDRAALAQADFSITAQNAGAVVALCRLLEGMPLAIEMAAAWIRTLSPQKTYERLERKMDLLVSRRRDLPARHQSLFATIEWSYDLLTPALRSLFAHLAVFRRSWSVEAAEAICGEETLDGLRMLQEHSLVICMAGDGEPRYRFLEPIREFAERKLRESEDGGRIARCHAAYFGGLSRKGKDHSREWFGQLEVERDNLRAAFDWLLADPDSALACLDFASRLQPFWQVRGYFSEGRERLHAALARPDARAHTPERARATGSAATLAMRQMDFPTAEQYHQESLTIWRTIGNRRGEASTLVGLGAVYLMQREIDTAFGYYAAARALYQELGDDIGLSDVLNDIGNIERHREDFPQSESYLRESLALRRRSGDSTSVANVLTNLAPILRLQGKFDEATDCLTECLTLCRVDGNRRDGVFALRGFAEIAEDKGDWERAVLLLGAEESLRNILGARRSPAGAKEQDARLAKLRDQRGDDGFEHAWHAGQSLSWEKAVACALEECESVAHVDSHKCDQELNKSA